MNNLLSILTISVLYVTLSHASLQEEIVPIQRYRLSLQGDGLDCEFPTTGLAGREKTHTWTEGKAFTIQIPLDGGVKSVAFADVLANGSQKVSVFLNEQFVRGYFFDAQHSRQDICINFPDTLVGPAMIKMEIPGACIPCNTDPRELGLALKTIELYNVPGRAKKFGNDLSIKQKDDLELKLNRLVVSDSLPLDTLQQLRDALSGIEQDIQAYANVKSVDKSKIWFDQFNVLPILQNKVEIAIATTEMVQKLTNKWNPEDRETPKPSVIGSTMLTIFADMSGITYLLDRCPIGILWQDQDGLREKANKLADDQTQQQLSELATNGDGLKKTYAREMLDFNIIIRNLLTNAHSGVKLSDREEENLQNKRELYRNRKDDLQLLGIQFKSREETYQEMLAAQLPVFTKINLVKKLIASLK